MSRALKRLLAEKGAALPRMIDAAAKRLAELAPDQAEVVADGRLFLYALLWWEAAEKVGGGKTLRPMMLEWFSRREAHRPLSWYAVRLFAARLILLDVGVTVAESALATRIVRSNFGKDDE